MCSTRVQNGLSSSDEKSNCKFVSLMINKLIVKEKERAERSDRKDGSVENQFHSLIFTSFNCSI